MYAKPCTDHLGNEFPTIKAMCEFYKVRVSSYRANLKKGLTQKQALTTPTRYRPKKIVTDHTGREFKTETEMCKFHNMCYSTYKWRINKGYTVEQALDPDLVLTSKTDEEGRTDHLGNVFKSKAQMCKHWGLNLTTFKDREDKGWPIDKILTTPVGLSTKREEARTDHTGRVFANVEEMCKFHGVAHNTFISRRAAGKSLEECLTPGDRRQRNRVQDHLGNYFNSEASMSAAYGLPCYTYYERIKRGWTIEQALTTPIDETLFRVKSDGESFFVYRLIFTSDDGTKFYLCVKGDEEEVLTESEMLQRKEGAA